MSRIAVYALHDPRTDERRYVGRSTDPHNRLAGHCGSDAASLMRAWVTTLGRERPVVRVMSWHESDDAARFEEGEQIARARLAGMRLLNTRPGGEEPRRRRLRSHGFGERLKACRKAKGWTQVNLSRATGIPQADLCRIEGGYRPCPSADRALRVAHALGVSVEWLVFGDGAAEALRVRDPGPRDRRALRLATRYAPVDPDTLTDRTTPTDPSTPAAIEADVHPHEPDERKAAGA